MQDEACDPLLMLWPEKRRKDTKMNNLNKAGVGVWLQNKRHITESEVEDTGYLSSISDQDCTGIPNICHISLEKNSKN